ncbi:MAG: serine/threonine protein kinase, partial [Candidatus Obscuribacterales bacterium]|nr:serine/threonine protein kinase [Steroidobacteraceae bacterium]
MSSRLDEILSALGTGTLTEDQACQSVSTAVRTDASGTQFWGMLIESRISQQKITPALGRKLLDAMENYEPEKTMWLAPTRAATAESTSPAIPSAPAPKPAALQDAEQLRAFLWDQPAKVSTPRSTDKIEWMEAPVQQKSTRQQPRPMPGVAAALPAPELGTVLRGRYRLDTHLGFGSIGQVFGAMDLEAERAGSPNPHVTIKLIAVDLKREPQARFALQTAVNRTKSLRHLNIVSTFGIESDDNRLFVTMEPLSGRWLGDLIREARKIGIAHDLAWPIVSGVANGLAYAHRENIVHSDLSPYSIFLTADGTPKIMGFGLIHALPTSNEAMDLLDTMTLRAYSEAYTADTWAKHAIPHSADDLYPLGVIAYELLTGAHPFQRHSLTTARQNNLTLAPIPGLNLRATKLIARCLSFERKERPKNAARFLTHMNGPALLRYIFGMK